MPTEQEIDDHKKLYGLESCKKNILVLGGSQGSLFLNAMVGRWLDATPNVWGAVHIIHQTGRNDSWNWKKWYEDRGITAHVFQYSNELLLWYACADLIVCRAGAGTLFEVAFFKKPCIIIPLITSETSHQVDNAEAMIEQFPGLFCMVNQEAIQKDPRALFLQLQHELKRLGL